MTRWNPYLLLSLLATVAALAIVTRANAADPPSAYTIAQAQLATWTCQDNMGAERTRKPATMPWALPRSRAVRVAVLNRWTRLYRGCRHALHEHQRQWNWQAWLPRNWYLVGSCETGYGGAPNWFHHNSSYVSAFGIQRGAGGGQYDNDAAKVGMPPWDDTHPPTPWQQYQTALSHYRSFGDGWGCPGP